MVFGILLSAQLSLADRIDEIRFVGNKRIKSWMLRNYLGFKEGEEPSRLKIQEGVQEVKNLEQVSNASFFFLTENNKRVLVIEVEEKWTLLPYLKGNIHASKKTYSIGLVEANVLGTLVESGFFYNNNDGRSGGRFFSKFPRELGLPADLNFDISKSTSDVGVFDLNSSKVGAYLQNDSKIKVGTGIPLNSKKTMLFVSAIEYSSQEITQDNLHPDDATLNATNNFKVATRDDRFTFSSSFIFGKMNKLNNYQEEGSRITASLGLPYSTHRGFLNPIVDGSYQISIPSRWTSLWAFRFRGARTFESGLFDILDTASLSGVRGYKGSQFQGQELLSMNLEYRIPSLAFKWFGLQHVFFVDGLYSRFPHYKFLSQEQRALTSGLGLRLNFPTIYKLNARIDYTVWGDPKPTSQLSISSHQYF